MLTLVLILLVSPILVIGKTVNTGEAKRDTDTYCTTNLGTFTHGSTFPSPSNPCLLYRCEHGFARIVGEGCYQDNTCHDVGTTWQSRDCHTNTCIQLQGGDNPVFHRKRLLTGCQDVYRVCRKPGEVFSFEQHGRIHRHCYCQPDHDVVDYYCID